MTEYARMKPLSSRRLTLAERGFATEMFGDGLDTARIRFFAIPYWDRAFTPGGRLMVWPARAAPLDFADTPLSVQQVFVHELTHVWQAQHGVNLLLGKLKAGDSDASYAYDLKAGPEFAQLNIEQQAMIVEDAFRASRGGRTPFAAELYKNAAVAWRDA